MKYKYGNEDLLVSPLLIKEIYYDGAENLGGITFTDFYRMGFTRDDMNSLCLYDFGNILEKENPILVVDFFKRFLQKESGKSILEKMQLYMLIIMKLK